MEWARALDGYCERLEPGLWAEPVNALSNLAFVVAALVMWRRCGRDGLPLARVMCGVLASIGVGSGLFHTFAQFWAMLADVLPIGLFILLYLYAANRDFWRLPVWAALIGVAAFVPYAVITVPVFERMAFFSVSAGYWPVALLIAAYGVGLRTRLPGVARGLGVGAALLGVSLCARSLDMRLCPVWPVGTHFVWHLLNGVLLGGLIELYRRHMVASGTPCR